MSTLLFRTFPFHYLFSRRICLTLWTDKLAIQNNMVTNRPNFIYICTITVNIVENRHISNGPTHLKKGPYLYVSSALSFTIERHVLTHYPINKLCMMWYSIASKTFNKQSSQVLNFHLIKNLNEFCHKLPKKISRVRYYLIKGL